MTQQSVKLLKSSKRTKVPPKLPTFIAKCVWDATSVSIKVDAKNEVAAWDSAWKKVSRMEGGDHCLKVVIKGRA